MAALLFVLLLAAEAAAARGVTVYIQRVLVIDPGHIRLGDLVRPSGAVPVSAGETLAQDLATISNVIVSIPSRFYMDRVENAFGQDSIFVGSRSLVVPRGELPDDQVALLGSFVDFLDDSGILGNEVLDIDVRSIQVNGTLPANAAPSFRLLRSSSGSVEATFTADGGAGPAGGRIILALKTDPLSTGADVRANDPVQVAFHKGLITIEMPGKALGQAAVGQPVNVLVTDNQRSFTGKLLSGKAVDVELP